MADHTSPDADARSDAERPLQFEQAEFAPQEQAPPACTACRQALGRAYFQLNAQVICAACRDRIAAALHGGPGTRRFLRAAGLGALAAVAGALLYFGIGALTGYEFGLVAILVGVLVGRAVRCGAAGRGGRAYQVLAVALTYLAIVSTYTPAIFRALRAQGQNREAAEAAARDKAKDQGAPAAAPTSRAAPGAVQVVVAFVVIGALILASPFLQGLQNIMGLLIIFFGLFEAWRVNRRPVLVLSGPYQLAPAVVPATSAPGAG